jgi:hypothetical protein
MFVMPGFALSRALGSARAGPFLSKSKPSTLRRIKCHGTSFRILHMRSQLVHKFISALANLGVFRDGICIGGEPAVGSLLRQSVVAVALISAPAFAQDFPNRPVTLVVPFAPGSGIDATARTIGEELSRVLKQPVVVDHKPGANGAIAASAVARAAPDGHTIFMTTVSTHSANPHLLKSIPYDPLKDFVRFARGKSTVHAGYQSKTSGANGAGVHRLCEG